MMPATAGTRFILELAGRRWRVHAEDCYDLSIPLQFDGPQPVFFGTAAASDEALTAGEFVGDVNRGGSCNCSTCSLTPHCNGTHTECVGHITRARVSVRDVARDVLVPALLVSVTPEATQETTERSLPAPQPGDSLITRRALESAVTLLSATATRALIIRTLPNPREKQHRDYTAQPAAYFSQEAMSWVVAQDIDHLVVDLPSVDRANDAGLLTAHRLFWGMPPAETDVLRATRAHATITELAFIDDVITDGPYLLNLQVAPFAADAAPSRPLLMRMMPT